MADLYILHKAVLGIVRKEKHLDTDPVRKVAAVRKEIVVRMAAVQDTETVGLDIDPVRKVAVVGQDIGRMAVVLDTEIVVRMDLKMADHMVAAVVVRMDLMLVVRMVAYYQAYVDRVLAAAEELGFRMDSVMDAGLVVDFRMDSVVDHKDSVVEEPFRHENL